MKASFLISYLERAGWQRIRQQGMHHILRHPDHTNLISVPDLGEQSLKPHLVNEICREAGLEGRVHRIQFNPTGIITMCKNLLGLNK